MTTGQAAPRTIDQLAEDLSVAHDRIATLEGIVVSASRNQRATAHTLTHFQNEKVRLQLEVDRLSPVSHASEDGARNEPSGTVFIDRVDVVYRKVADDLYTTGMAAGFGFDVMAYPVQVIRTSR